VFESSPLNESDWNTNSHTDNTRRVADNRNKQQLQLSAAFSKRLHKRYKIPVYRCDERYSSIEAARLLAENRNRGNRKKVGREDLDKVAAAIIPVGELNISFYRDDFSRIGLHPRVGASNIPYSIDGETIVLVDDVLYSGRTVRAAMNELFDFGRPERIILATLVERNGRELPVCADVVGCKMRLDQNETIKLTDDLSLVVKSI